MSILALALAGCAQTGQSPFEARLSSDDPIPSQGGQAIAPQLGDVASLDGAAPAEAAAATVRDGAGESAPGAPAQAEPVSTHAMSTQQIAAFAPAPAHAPLIAGVSLAAYERREAGILADPILEGQKTQVQRQSPTQLASAPSRAEGRRWRPAYPHVRTECFPEKLRAALERIGDHFDAEVLVTSGARKSGRRGSLHRACKAADIRVAGVSLRKVAQFARKLPGVNGVGSYRWISLTHIDIRDERFAWRW